ncbi:hypothetical protein ABT324_24325 [Saccharopolyspora sp. NPDC000359]|uniref:hypothetical protein n=1 Tax=Saccharopolyspora sp. NPDC000359 TaxID=3154251 RepID=UPI00331EE13A
MHVGHQVLKVGPPVTARPRERAVGGQVLDEDAELAQRDLAAPELGDDVSPVGGEQVGLYRFRRRAEEVDR